MEKIKNCFAIEGRVEIDPETTLESPKWYINNVIYDYQNGSVAVEAHFFETGYKHSRTYTIDSPKQWTDEAIFERLMEKAVFANSSPI